MYIITAHLDRPITFFVDQADPTKLEIRQWLWLVNPLVPVGERYSDEEITRIRGGYFVRAPTVRFLVTDSEYRSPEAEYNLGLDELPSLLRSTRLESCDPYLPVQVRGESLERLERNRLPARRLGGEVVTNALLGPSPTGQRIAHRLREFARNLRAGPIEHPVYGELALDAIESQDTDPRRSILFAALAIEQMAAARLDRVYMAAQADQRMGWRWISQKDGVAAIDPVFEKLRSASRNSWRMLLVEVPLYALGRSVLHDDKRLYDLAIRLRKIRNYLSHGGPAPEDDLFPLDAMGAHLALRVGERLFSWFGERNYFWALPRSDEMVDVDSALEELTTPLTLSSDPVKGPVRWSVTGSIVCSHGILSV